MTFPSRLVSTRALCAMVLGAAAQLSACTAALPPVFVTFPAADAVQRVDPETGRVLSHTVVGMLPHHLVASRDGRSVYVVVTGSQSIAELDAQTGALTRTFLTEPVPTHRPDGSVIQAHLEEGAASHTTCFSCHGRAPGGARPAIVGGRPFGAVLSPDGTRLFVTNLRTGTLSRIALETAALEEVRPLEPSGAAHEPTALARLDETLFVSVLPTLPSLEPGVVRRLPVGEPQVLSELATGPNAGTITADETLGDVFVSHFETNAVSRMDAQGQVTARYTVGDGPLGTLVRHERVGPGALLVSNYYGNSLSRVDLATGQVQTQSLVYEGKPMSNPTHLALHGDVVLALSSGTEGHLVALDARTLKPLHAQPIAGLPFGLLIAPTSKGSSP